MPKFLDNIQLVEGSKIIVNNGKFNLPNKTGEYTLATTNGDNTFSGDNNTFTNPITVSVLKKDINKTFSLPDKTGNWTLATTDDIGKAVEEISQEDFADMFGMGLQ